MELPYKWFVKVEGQAARLLATDAEVGLGDFLEFDGQAFLVIRRVFGAQGATLFAVPSTPKWPAAGKRPEEPS